MVCYVHPHTNIRLFKIRPICNACKPTQTLSIYIGLHDSVAGKKSDSDSDSDDEVRDELPFLRQENERLGSLLDNHDDILREAKKLRKELRASLEDARTRVVDLETQVLDSKLEIDSLKASPIVSGG
jgi:flagellar motility protein MotE (MotC chaperone)